MSRDLATAQRQHGRSEIDKADQLAAGRSRIASIGIADNQRDLDSRVVDPAFHPRQAVPVIAVEEHDRLVGQSVFLQLSENPAHPLVHHCDVVVLPGEIPADDRCIGIVRRDRDVGRVDAAG